jgi:hypothetical protein
MALVYQHRKPGTLDIFYIGRAKSKKRLFSKSNRNEFWHNIVNKYGGFEVDILAENLTWEESGVVEKDYILKIGRRDLGTGPLVNLTDGGEGVENIIISNETRSKLKAAKIGNKNGSGNKGKKRGSTSEETKKKIGNSNRGKIHSYQSKLNMSNAHIGNTHSEETKEKMRGPRGKQKNPNTIKLTCPHCGKIGSISNMKKSHFDNCKTTKDLFF